MAKKTEFTVKDVIVKTMTKNGIDYICITDIARQKNALEPKDVVKNWMRQKNTLEYLGLWERLYNPFFKGVEFDPLLANSGSNSFTMSPSRWVELTGAIGIITKNGVGGGTFAQHDIAFKFANWISVEFELYLVKEFQRLKTEEQKQLGWSAKRELSKINYRIHTDAILHNLIPQEVTPLQAGLTGHMPCRIYRPIMKSGAELFRSGRCSLRRRRSSAKLLQVCVFGVTCDANRRSAVFCGPATPAPPGRNYFSAIAALNI